MITYTHTQVLHLLGACGDGTLQAEMTLALKGDGPTGSLEPVGLLHHAAALNRILAIEPMRRARADLDLKDREGWSPAMRAVSRKNDDFVRELHRCGADLARDRLKDNSTLMHVASFFDRPGLIGLLLGLGLEVDAKNGRQRTPAHEAHKNLFALQRLVQAGARLDIPDFEGNTVIHLAAMACSPDVIGFLMARDVDLDRPNLANQSPMDLLMAHRGPKHDVALMVQSGLAARRAIIEMTEMNEILRALSLARTGRHRLRPTDFH